MVCVPVAGFMLSILRLRVLDEDVLAAFDDPLAHAAAELVAVGREVAGRAGARKLIALPARTSFRASTTSSTFSPGPLPTAMICFDQSAATGLFAFSMASAMIAIWSCVLGGNRYNWSSGAPISLRNFL